MEENERPTSEQIEAAAEAIKAIVEALRPVIEEAARMLREFGEFASDVLKRVAAVGIPTANALVDEMLYQANDNPKWWYLYKHAKKSRTRKKYRRLLMQQLLNKLEADNKEVSA